MTRSYVSLLNNHARTPSLELALKIERLTGGVVAVDSWKKVVRVQRNRTPNRIRRTRRPS